MKLNIVVQRGTGAIEEKNGKLMVYTNEKRENNRANVDVIKQIAKYFSVPQTAVRIVSGFTSRKKLVEVVTNGETADR